MNSEEIDAQIQEMFKRLKEQNAVRYEYTPSGGLRAVPQGQESHSAEDELD